jgi:hypothetical protein
MAEVLLTFHCALADADMLADVIRSHSKAALHRRAESVLGRDFDDADTTERVSGILRRQALELIIEEEMVDSIVAAVTAARRALPVRWHAVPVVRRGRIA